MVEVFGSKIYSQGWEDILKARPSRECINQLVVFRLNLISLQVRKFLRPLAF